MDDDVMLRRRDIECLTELTIEIAAFISVIV